MAYWKVASVIEGKDAMDHLLAGRDVLFISYEEDPEEGWEWSVRSLRELPLGGIQAAIKRNAPKDIFLLLS